MSELFAAGHEDHEPGSPKKLPTEPVIAPKGAGSQKFSAPRLFADDPDEPAAVGYKSNPAKYNHFDIGDPNEEDSFQHHEEAPKPKTIPMRAKSNKHNSQWDFADFHTPEKVNQKVRDQDVVHFSLANSNSKAEGPQKLAGRPRRDNETHFEMKDAGTPIERHAVPQPRKDAETHFEFRDTATPAPSRIAARPGSSSDRMGLYSNEVFDHSEGENQQGKAPLSTITNNAHRHQDFDSHWSMSNESPSNEKTQDENKAVRNHRKMPSQMETHWDMRDAENQQPGKNGQARVQKSFWDF
jgi:hypothetical protein